MSNLTLTADQIYEFLDLGYLKISLGDTSLGKDFSARMFRHAREAYRKADLSEGHRGRIRHIADERIDCLPEVQQLLSSRELNGALGSLLGKNFYRYRHSFIHRADRFDQSFHKDSPLPWGTTGGIRSHKLEWVMLFYYPQDTTLALGPTEIIPGSQYWNVDRIESGITSGEDRLGIDFDRQNMGSSPDLALRDKFLESQWKSMDEYTQPIKVEVSAGTVVLVHFDLFHRATRINCDGERYMYKFWYTRTSEPTNTVKQRDSRYQIQDLRREPIVNAIGSWMNLAKSMNGDTGTTYDSTEYTLEASEPNRMCRSYVLAKQNQECLIEEVCSGIEATRRAAVYALASQPNLAEKAIARLITSDDVHDRQCALFLIGECCSITHPLMESVMEMILDCEAIVSKVAIIALGRLKRRQLSPLTEIAHRQIVDRLLKVLHTVDSDDSQRQLAYLSLLNFASDSLNPILGDQIANIERAVHGETNKYALSTGNEVLARANRARHSLSLS